MLSIRCELLMGTYQATDPFGAPEACEWPPHPFRLHAALTSAACEEGGERPSDASVEALRWLERLGPPDIASSAHSPRATPLFYVPRNPVAAEFARSRDQSRKQGYLDDPRKRLGRAFPTSIPRDPVVIYRWRVDEPAPSALERLVAAVAWLGSSRSPVACALADDPERATTLSPRPDGAVALRVAGEGMTDALLTTRHQWPPAVAGEAVSYGDVAAMPAHDIVVGGPFEELVVRGIARPVLDLGDTPTITHSLRNAVLSQAGDHAPSSLHGHTQGGKHVAFLVLGDVGGTHSTGLAHGVGMAIPRGIPRGDRDRCVEAFARVNPLTLGPGLCALRLTDAEGLYALRPDRWARPSRHFSSVTPLVLDRFPKRGRSVFDEVLVSIKNAGLPEPEKVDIPPGPPLSGCPAAQRMRGHVPPGIQVHVSLVFPFPVRGPLVVGRGRFRGIGLLAPVSEAPGHALGTSPPIGGAENNG